MDHHEDLADADRLIANCMDRLARQREVITTRYEQGLPTDASGADAAGIREKPARLIQTSAVPCRLSHSLVA
jgi:hypothetical protein